MFPPWPVENFLSRKQSYLKRYKTALWKQRCILQLVSDDIMYFEINWSQFIAVFLGDNKSDEHGGSTLVVAIVCDSRVAGVDGPLG